MELENKPIKRSAELAPLSREHHDGLLLGWKLRQGIKRGVTTARMAAYIKWFWTAHLVPHFKKEETFLPHVLPNDHPLMQQMLAEHAAIKKSIEDIDATSAYTDFEALAELVNQHIRFEERVLFNEVEQKATGAQMLLLATQLSDDNVDEVWDDIFWMDKK